MSCSAGGPMEITILNVDEDDTTCNDCGKTFRRPKKKARCPECGSENLATLQGS
jgi:predicted Zn-ribbon and HTH transcriptional regulator